MVAKANTLDDRELGTFSKPRFYKFRVEPVVSHMKWDDWDITGRCQQCKKNVKISLASNDFEADFLLAEE